MGKLHSLRRRILRNREEYKHNIAIRLNYYRSYRKFIDKVLDEGVGLSDNRDGKGS